MGEVVKNLQNGILPICFAITCCVLCFNDLALANHSDSAADDNSFSVLGKTPPNKLFVGMFTYHFDPESLEERNWNNQLLGLQINGFFVGTLLNSFDKRSWAFGISREVYRNHLSIDWSFSAGYRVGLVTGYKNEDSIFNTESDTVPYIDLHGQFTYLEHFGIELMLTSSLSVCFFYQF